MATIKDIEKYAKQLERVRELDAQCLEIEKMGLAAVDGLLKLPTLSINSGDSAPKARSESPLGLISFALIGMVEPETPETKSPVPVNLKINLTDHLVLCVLDVLWRQLDAERRAIVKELEAA